MEHHNSCKSVLVVEDDDSIRESMIEMLEMEGYSTYSAINGQEALKLLNGNIPKPCLVLLDMMMPIMNGREFLDQMMKDSVLAPIPVLIVSAVADPASSKGSIGFLKKPIDIESVLTIVAKYCC
jgi:CheY-like chemotaxis protein